MKRYHCVLLFALASVALLSACDESGSAVRHQERAHIVVEESGEGCLDSAVCDEGYICVADRRDGPGRCVVACSEVEGDVCPQGERCATVADASGAKASACIVTQAPSSGSWQPCDHQDACGSDERCVTLDAALGSRCVPSCTKSLACEDPQLACALSWQSGEGLERGCVASCVRDSDCGSAGKCLSSASLGGGVCVW